MSRRKNIQPLHKKAKLENTAEEVILIEREIEMLEKQKEKLEQELKQKHANTSEKLTEGKNVDTLKEAANRWTDNIFAVKSWCKKKYMIEDKVLNKQFGIPEDLDYLP